MEIREVEHVVEFRVERKGLRYVSGRAFGASLVWFGFRVSLNPKP